MSDIKPSPIYILIVLLFTLMTSISNIQAQVSVPSDLSKVKIDDLSDDQIQMMLQKAQSYGLTEDQMESIALSKGMPASEVEKLRQRIANLNPSNNNNNQNVNINQSRMRQPIPIEKRKKGEDIFKALSQQNVQQATNLKDSIEKRIFGYDLFNNDNLTFEPSFNIPTPQNYQLGAGDQLVIDVWGASQANYNQTISPEGSIMIPNVGPILINGLTIEMASKRIIGRLSSIYAGLTSQHPNTFAQVNLGSVRSIKVTLVGDVRTPGSYTLPSLSTVFNALYVSGGPSITGSFRNVKIFRENKVVSILDVYDFLIKGDQCNNVRLQDQDIVMISPYKIRVDIQGEVKRPALYEMSENETIENLINFAGGFSEKAYTSRLKIIRNTAKEHKIIDIPADSFTRCKLRNGDLIKVEPILERFENRIQITGAVYRQGSYEMTPGLTLRELIRRADGLKSNAFLTRSIIYRTNDDYSKEAISIDLSSLLNENSSDISLQREDSIKVFSISELQENFTVKVDGEVLKPGDYPFIYNTNLENMIATAGGFKESASLSKVEIARRIKNSYADSSSSEVAKVFSFKVSKDLKLSDSASKFVLEPFDIISIRQSPGYEFQAMVTIKGEVNFAGNYSLSNKEERISDLIKRSGGLTSDAYVQGARLIRTIQEDEKTRQNLIKLLEEQTNDTVILGTAGGKTQALGINLEKILKNPHSKYDLTLQENDLLIVPKALQTVRISGAILYPIIARYDKRFGFRKYISLAGGFSEVSSSGKSFVIYADGTVDRTRNFLFFHSYPTIEPGAEIVVPKKPENKNKLSPQEVVALATSISSLSLVIITLVRLF